MLFLVVQTLLAALCVAALLIALVFRSRRQRNSIGFFHPYSDDGGGGERVLWCAIAALHKSAPNTRVVVFTAPPRDGNHDPEKIKQRAKDRFNVEITGDVTFIWLFHRQWVEASSWPRATMVGQSLGSLLLGFEALSQFNPECFIDTMGYAFTLPMARWMCGCSIAAYVHYPTISSDMEDMVASGNASHNNTSAVARSRLRTTIKLCYYRVFKALYSLAGMHAEKVMVNSSWTMGHISNLWGGKPVLLYPPCNVDKFRELPLQCEKRSNTVISIAQFRPEKNHALQVKAFAHFLKLRPEAKSTVRLALIGSVRNAGDEARVDSLRELAKELKIAEQVDFRLNVSFAELLDAYKTARVGLHTMWNEHFGIGVVEMMAAGVITIAHNSAGPKMDIVQNADGPTGFLAETEEEYARKIEKAFYGMNSTEQRQMAEAARESSKRFTDPLFAQHFMDVMAPLIGGCEAEGIKAD